MAEEIGNMEVYPDKVVVSVNPKIYPLDVVYSAAYVLIDKAYILIDGDPKNEIIVELRSKNMGVNEGGLKALGNEFNEQLISYAVYKTQSQKNAPLRQAIIERALLTNEFVPEDASNLDFDKDDEDPDGIAVPWDERQDKNDNT